MHGKQTVCLYLIVIQMMDDPIFQSFMDLLFDLCEIHDLLPYIYTNILTYIQYCIIESVIIKSGKTKISVCLRKESSQHEKDY